ncbi:MAG: 30S ribosomal protein S21 [Bacilli bacterium]|nr:30S ribosomal protein S21 [Bacilli bacterium]
MTKVIVKNGDINGALRTIKQKVARDGSLKKAREINEGYVKPGVKKRNAKKEAIKNSRKKSRKDF